MNMQETKELDELILKLRDEEQLSILLIEHDMDVAFELAENITVLQMGKLVASGDKEDIKANKTVQEIYLGTEQ